MLDTKRNDVPQMIQNCSRLAEERNDDTLKGDEFATTALRH